MGTPGAVAGTTAALAAVYALSPTIFVDFAHKTYVEPLVRPVMVQLVAGRVGEQEPAGAVVFLMTSGPTLTPPVWPVPTLNLRVCVPAASEVEPSAR